ncbi:MAG: DUF1080 domain-containing protein [Planctomycetes bacterium]|nr:DUF1080 domain-containing protein [Planctomycetota bacterium]
MTSLLCMLACVVVESGGAATSAPAVAQDAASKAAAKIPVLIVTGENNHDWIYTTPKIEAALKATGRFDVDITIEPGVLLADAAAIAKYRCFVLDYNGARWGEAAEKNFVAAVRGGVGVSVIHAANNAFPGWIEYEQMVADLWRDGTGHGSYHAFDVKMVDRDHPITRGLPDLKQHPDELYHLLVHTPGITTRVLATAFADPKMGGTGNDEPMVIVLEFGAGRVFHTPLGHVWSGVVESRATYDDPQLDLLIARGTEWAATGDVTLPTVPANRLSPDEEAAGFKLLFDGKSGAGWRGFAKLDFPEQGWEATGGALHVVAGGGGGDLVSAEQFGDFELRFEWKVATGANSGVMYRVSEELATPWQTGPEYQVLDDANHPDGQDRRTGAGSLYGLLAALGRELRPVGEWNSGRIVVKGWHVEHWVNENKVVDQDLAGADAKKLIAASKFGAMPKFATATSGHLCLQDHGNDVWFRSLRVRRL